MAENGKRGGVGVQVLMICVSVFVGAVGGGAIERIFFVAPQAEALSTHVERGHSAVNTRLEILSVRHDADIAEIKAAILRLESKIDRVLTHQ